MIQEKKYHLELITPCFCGGAEPEKSAEIRAPSIRGQLRWWFRTLGGFRSLPGDVKAQEDMIFGSASGDQGNASKLIVRVAPIKVKSQVKDAKQMNADVNSPKGYLLFPIRSNERKQEYNGRGVFAGSLPSFDVSVVWKGPASVLPDIEALITVFGHLGSLGFRSRRAMGALAFSESPGLPLEEALACFRKSEDLHVFRMAASDSENAISVLANWLKSWRSYGRSPDNLNPFKEGLQFARQDHDIAAKNAQAGTSFRPALGLPIITKYGEWDQSWNVQRRKGEGRFASPVLLRPHRDEAGKWYALVIFVDVHKWPERDKVFLNGCPMSVSLDLYEAMKNDGRLQAFVPRQPRHK